LILLAENKGQLYINIAGKTRESQVRFAENTGQPSAYHIPSRETIEKC
jgi:hypothetical protein